MAFTLGRTPLNKVWGALKGNALIIGKIILFTPRRNHEALIPHGFGRFPKASLKKA
jgi:hypothetical protein